jgi:hypothetical protein
MARHLDVRLRSSAIGHERQLTIGASTTKQVGRALNLKAPASIKGAIGAGGAVALELEAFNCKMPERSTAFFV